MIYYRYNAVGSATHFKLGDSLKVSVISKSCEFEHDVVRRWCLWLSDEKYLFEVVIERKEFGLQIFTVLREHTTIGEIPGKLLHRNDSQKLSLTLDVVYCETTRDVKIFINGMVEPFQLELTCPFMPNYVSFGGENVFQSADKIDDVYAFDTVGCSSNFSLCLVEQEKSKVVYPSTSIVLDNVSGGNETFSPLHAPSPNFGFNNSDGEDLRNSLEHVISPVVVRFRDFWLWVLVVATVVLLVLALIILL
nr:P30 [Carrot closterovirus 2]